MDLNLTNIITDKNIGQFYCRMLTKSVSKFNKNGSFTIQPALIVKLHISPTLQTEISLTPNCDIDAVIQQCIMKYKLKKQAHPFLKQQIMKFVDLSEPVLKSKNQSFSLDQESENSFSKNQLSKKKIIIKDIKAGDIDQAKVTIQRTPKNSQSFSFKKESLFKASKFVSESTQNNRKNQLKKKKASEKQNSESCSMSNSISFEQKMRKNFSMTATGALFSRKTELNKKSSKQNSTINKNLFQIQKQISSFLSKDVPAKRERERKFKTVQSEFDNSMRMTQFSLKDLENEMHQQVVDLKYEKKVKNLQLQLRNLFNSIIRYNPPKINNIDPRYACFQDLDQKLIQSLHQFLIQLKDQELNSLDFDNFKKLLVKYRGEVVLNCLK